MVSLKAFGTAIIVVFHMGTKFDGNAVYNTREMIERSFPTITGSSAKSGAQKSRETSSGKNVAHPAEEVKQSFSVSEEMGEAYLDTEEAGNMETAQPS